MWKHKAAAVTMRKVVFPPSAPTSPLVADAADPITSIYVKSPPPIAVKYFTAAGSVHTKEANIKSSTKKPAKKIRDKNNFTTLFSELKQFLSKKPGL